MATDEEIARVGVEDAQDAGRENPVGENQPEAPEHSDEPNGSSGADIGIDTSDKQPVQELEVPIVPIVNDISL